MLTRSGEFNGKWKRVRAFSVLLWFLNKTKHKTKKKVFYFMRHYIKDSDSKEIHSRIIQSSVRKTLLIYEELLHHGTGIDTLFCDRSGMNTHYTVAYRAINEESSKNDETKENWAGSTDNLKEDL